MTSLYAINAVKSPESGSSNIQLYTRIRQLLVDFENIFKCCWNSYVSGPHSTHVKISAFSILKVKDHSGNKGNVKADMLAERGRFEICNATGNRCWYYPQVGTSPTPPKSNKVY